MEAARAHDEAPEAFARLLEAADLAEVVARLTGSGDLVEVVTGLVGLDTAAMPAPALVEAVVGWQRVVSSAVAAQAAVIRELAARDRDGRYVPDDLALALVGTRAAAARLVGRAEDLGRLPVLADALASGRLDVAKVDAIRGELPPCAEQTEWGPVVAAAVEAAGDRTAPALRRWTSGAVLAARPDEGAARAERARAERCVRLDAGPDGMAWLTAFLPAADAVAVFTVVDALAGTTDRDEDARTVDQRRADAFSGLFTHVLDTGVCPDGTALPTRHGRRAAIQVTVAATTLLGLDDQPAELAGYGPLDAGTARRIAQDGTWRRILTDPATGVAVETGRVRYRPGADLTATVVARDVTCTFPGCGQPAGRGDLDHVVPFTRDRPAATQTTPDNLQALCRHQYRCP